MASLSDVIDIIIRADDQASRAISAVGEAVSGLDAKVQGLARPFADMANAVLAADAALAAVTLTIGTLAVKETVQFQDSLYLVQKQLGNSGVSIEQARQDIEALGLTYGTNANEVAKSVAGFLAAGYDYETAASLVKTSTGLMIAGELDAQTATDAITKSLAGFKVPAGEAAGSAEHVGDVLNKIGDISSGKFTEIVAGFERIAPTAKDAGLSMEETAGYLAVLVDKFGSGEVAATALKSGFLSLLDPSKEAKSTLDALGVATTNNNGELRSAKDILADLAGKYSTLTESQRLQTAAILFGKDQAGAMNALVGDWAKAQDYVAQMLDKTTGAVGSMAREVEGKLNLISTSVDVTKESWRQFLENLGARIVADGGLQDLIRSVGSLGDAFKGVVTSGGMDEIIQWAQDGFARLSEIIAKVAENLPKAFEGVDWSGLIDALDDLGATAKDVFSGLFGDIDLTTVDGLTSAIQTVVNSFETLTRMTEGIAKAFQPVAEAIGQTVIHFNDLSKADKVDFGETIGSAKVLIDVGTGLGLALIAIGKAGIDMGATLDFVFGSAKVVINSLQVAFDTAMLGILKAVQTGLGIAGFKDRADELQVAIDAVYENALRNSGELKDGWSQAMGEAGGKTDEFRDRLTAAEQGLLTARDATAGAAAALGQVKTAAGEAAAGFAEATYAANEARLVSDPFVEMTKGMGSATSVAMIFADAVGDGSAQTKELKMTSYDLLTQVGETKDGVTRFTFATKDSSKALDENAKKAKEATEKSDEYRLKLEEIASNERIKTIEAVVSIKTAQLETDAERVKATFASIDTTISSTGDLLGSLFDNLTSADNFRDKWNIEDQIDKENKRRQEALDMQKALAEAEIERIQAQTEALNRGDALIKIDGTNLAPQLEAFMWEVLKAIRVRANADFQDYLLGLGVG